MPAEVFGPDFAFLPRAELLTFEEIAVVARELVALGARTLRITGGEPLVRRDLERLVALLRALDVSEALGGEPLDLALTTNGSLLAKLATPLRAAGLNRITVSLDSLTPETFTRMSGSALPLESVLEGIAAAADAGFTQIKLNAVIRADQAKRGDQARGERHGDPCAGGVCARQRAHAAHDRIHGRGDDEWLAP